MVKIRLKRFGRTHHPYYRVSVMDQRSARDSKVIEELGFYDPKNKEEARQVSLKEDRVRYWLGVGAQPSDTVASLIKRVGINTAAGATGTAG